MLTYINRAPAGKVDVVHPQMAKPRLCSTLGNPAPRRNECNLWNGRTPQTSVQEIPKQGLLTLLPEENQHSNHDHRHLYAVTLLESR